MCANFLQICQLGSLKLIKYHYEIINFDDKLKFYDPSNRNRLLYNIILSDSVSAFVWLCNELKISTQYIIEYINELDDTVIIPHIFNYVLENLVVDLATFTYLNAQNITQIESSAIFKNAIKTIECIPDDIISSLVKQQKYYLLDLYLNENPQINNFTMLYNYAKADEYYSVSEMMNLINKYGRVYRDTITHEHIAVCLVYFNKLFYNIIYSLKPIGIIPYEIYLNNCGDIIMLKFLFEKWGYAQQAIDLLSPDIINPNILLTFFVDNIPNKISIDKIIKCAVLIRNNNMHLTEWINCQDIDFCEYTKTESKINRPDVFFMNDCVITRYDSSYFQDMGIQMPRVTEYKNFYIYQLPSLNKISPADIDDIINLIDSKI